MPTEPTAEERQRQAFYFLRGQARNAHIAGDGLLVGVICHTGLQNINRLAKEKKLLLPFSEIAWMPIFILYWLVIPTDRYALKETLQSLEHSANYDRLVAQWIDRYYTLIEQPLNGDAGLAPLLKDFAWPISFSERSPETETLVTHMVELAWFHGPNGEDWKHLVDTWRQKAPSWTEPLLLDLKGRLELQARLTSPEKFSDLVPENDAEKLRVKYDLAELWLLHFYGRAAAVCDAAERPAGFLADESHRWRIVHDFFHFDGISAPNEDSQYVQLARRRRLSVGTPLLIFHDERESRIKGILGELFRERSQGGASKRWEIYVLAQLHELAALRIWDYGMWLESIRAQAQTTLEVVQWPNADAGMSARGLAQSVWSLSSNSPKKDPIIRRAVDVLEFAPDKVLVGLGNALIATYPKQKSSAAGLLEDIVDLLPPEIWPGLARWTASYIQESSEQRTAGWHYAPAAYWRRVLFALSQDSPVWDVLLPEAMRMAKVGHCWLGESGEFLRRWLLLAPVAYARELAEAMLTHPESSPLERFERAQFLIEFEEWNPYLRGAYSRRLLLTAGSVSEAFILADHLKAPDVVEREDGLRKAVVHGIRESVAKAAPDLSVKAVHFLPNKGPELVGHWRLEDRPLLEELIAAVNSSTVFTQYVPWLLQVIQLLVANGPIEFANIVQPYVVDWTDRLPTGRKVAGADSGPLSVVQWHLAGEGDIALMLGWLVFQLLQKLGVQVHSIVLAWVRQMLLIDASEPLDMAAYQSAIIALQAPSESTESLALMETALISLRARMDRDQDAVVSLTNTLRRISDLIDSDAFPSPSVADLGHSSDAFIDVLSRFIPVFARSSSASLRAVVASVVWQLRKRGKTDMWITETLLLLEGDRRARVRFEAQGGWKEARNRALATGAA